MSNEIRLDEIASNIINAIPKTILPTVIRAIENAEEANDGDDEVGVRFLDITDDAMRLTAELIAVYDAHGNRDYVLITGTIHIPQKGLLIAGEGVAITDMPETFVDTIKSGEKIEKYIDVEMLKGRTVKDVVRKNDCHVIRLEKANPKTWEKTIKK